MRRACCFVADRPRGPVVFFFGDHTFAWYPSAVRLLDFESNYAQFCKRSKVRCQAGERLLL